MNNKWLRITLYFLLATFLSNIFRFELFGVDEFYSGLPLWCLVFTGPLQSFGVLLAALLAYFFLKKKVNTKYSLFGTSKVFSLMMGLVLILTLGIIGLENTDGIPKNLLGILSGISFLFYCLFEEYGWRGYLGDELYAMKPISRILLTALLWYTWHLSFLSQPDVLVNLKFFGILVIGSWGIEQVIKSTKSILSAACFHSIYNILMMQSAGKITFTMNQKLIVIGVCLVFWILIIRIWERMANSLRAKTG